MDGPAVSPIRPKSGSKVFDRDELRLPPMLSREEGVDAESEASPHRWSAGASVASEDHHEATHAHAPIVELMSKRDLHRPGTATGHVGEELFPDHMDLREAEAVFLDEKPPVAVPGRGLRRFRDGVRKYIIAHRASQQFIPLEYREQRERQKSRERGSTFVDVGVGRGPTEELHMLEGASRRLKKKGRKIQPGIHTPETPPRTGDALDDDATDGEDGGRRPATGDGGRRGESRGSGWGERGGTPTLLQIVGMDPALRKEYELRILVNKLLSHSYFGEKGYEIVLELARHIRLQCYAKDDMIFYPKDGQHNAGAFYILVSGQVSVEVGYEKMTFDVCNYTTGETFNRAPSHKTAARCVTDCNLMCVTLADVEAAVNHIEETKMAEKIHFFRQLPHFHDLHIEDLRTALLPFTQNDHTCNQVISCQGEKKHFDKLFVVITGECRIIKKLILPTVGADAAPRRRRTSFLDDLKTPPSGSKVPSRPAKGDGPAKDGSPRHGAARRNSLGREGRRDSVGRRASASGRHNSVNTVAEFYELGQLQAGDFFGDCSSFAVGGAKPSMWNEGPDYSVISLCFTRVYAAPCSALVKNANPAIRACFGEIRTHLERVSTAYEHQTILSLHQKSVAWERYKRKVVKEQVAPHFISCGHSYGNGTLPAEGTVDDAPKRKPKPIQRKEEDKPEEEDGKQDGISNEIRQIFGSARTTSHVGTSKQNNSRLTIT